MQPTAALDRGAEAVQGRGMSVAERMREKLQAGLAPSELEIVDESAAHEGHAGARPGGETHFRLHVVSAAFDGLSRLDRQRLVHRLLAEELADRVHALSVSAKAPGED